MRWTALLLACFGSGLVAAAATPTEPPASAVAAVEAQLRERVAVDAVTVVHFWAPWCGNCRAEHEDQGWARFLAANPDVTVVFVEAWNDGRDSRASLEKYGLGPQANLVTMVHPGPRRGPDRMQRALDLPVQWLPTTWVFRAGRLRYAFNYGEIRFPLLQQCVDDARESWAR